METLSTDTYGWLHGHNALRLSSYGMLIVNIELIQDCVDMDCTRGNGSHDPVDAMDCDGPNHALVRDVDGSQLGSSPLESSILPYAKLRYSAYFIFP